MTERSLTKKFFDGKISKKELHKGLSKIATKRNTEIMKKKSKSKTKSMSSSKW
jgi:hypothetical protein